MPVRSPPKGGLTSLFVAGLLTSALPAGARPAAADPFAACERRFAENPQAELACGCFFGIGSRQPDLAEEAAARLTRHLEQNPGNACLLLNLGQLERRLRRASAEAHLQAAAIAHQQRGQAVGEVYARLNLVDILSGRGDGEAVVGQLALAQIAAQRAEKAGQLYLVAEVQVRQARLLLQQGQSLEVAEALLEAAAERAATAHPSLKRDTWQTLGAVQHQLGRHDQAEASWRQMIEVTRQKLPDGRTDLYGEALARQNLAAAYLARPPSPANRAGAIERFEEALAAAVAGGHLAAEADARRWLGRLQGGDAGRRSIETSIALARQLKDQFLLRLGLAALAAELTSEGGDPERARQLLAEARRLEPSGDADLDLYGFSDRMAASWALDGPAEATRIALAELKAIEAWRELQKNSLTRAEAFSVWADAYSWLAGHLLAEAELPGRLEQAFHLLEHRHARLLLEKAGRAGTVAGEGMAKVSEVQAALGPDEALLYFQQAYQQDFFGDFIGGSWLLVIGHDRTRVYRTADPLVVDRALPFFVDLLRPTGAGEPEGAENGAEIAQAAAALGSGLLGEALAELETTVNRLIVVPDGDLQLLPFAALRDNAAAPPLATRFEIAIAPSATLWLERRRQPRAPAPPTVLALADPARPSALHQNLPPLPAARGEARDAVRRLGGKSALWLGAEASEAALLAADLEAFGLLHLAAHGIREKGHARGEDAAIVLGEGGGADGLLRAAEVYRLKLRGQAVVLSACRSADGDVLAGEGALSLAHAFYGAGARTVVASLWPLGDQGARRFFERFYRQLAAGRPASAALATAQRESLADGLPSRTWAGLVLLGDPDFTLAPIPAGWPKGLLYLALVGALLLLFAKLRR